MTLDHRRPTGGPDLALLVRVRDGLRALPDLDPDRRPAAPAPTPTGTPLVPLPRRR